MANEPSEDVLLLLPAAYSQGFAQVREITSLGLADWASTPFTTSPGSQILDLGCQENGKLAVADK